jgi:CRP-like cAMP-binding protein
MKTTETVKNFGKRSSDILGELFIFKDIPKEKTNEYLKMLTLETETFSAGETIYCPESFKRKVGFILNGECYVERKKSDGSTIPLNILKKGDSFGILALFSDNDQFPTCVRAKKLSTIAFISKTDLESLVRMDPDVAINIIKFMSGRISFLNRKVTTFSSDNVSQRIAHFLLNEYKQYDNVAFPINCKKTSESLNVGRASLYRTLYELSDEGIISFENKKIEILDLKGLERITK